MFYGSVCCVCFSTIKEKKLKKCSSCKSCFYCSKEHQQIDWKCHKSLCKVIQEIDLVLKPECLDSKVDWYKHRTKFMVLCELKLQRKLKPLEVHTILFPKNCEICHKKSNLEVCPNCLSVNYCSEDHKKFDFPFHKNMCQLFALSLELDLGLLKKPCHQDYKFQETNISLQDTMSGFIERNLLVKKQNFNLTEHQKILISEQISSPLSVLFAMAQIGYKIKKNEVLHVVGSSFFEAISPKYWELLLHANHHVEKLIVHFIGPEVKINPDVRMCHLCRNKLVIKFSKKFYHEYVKSSIFEKPTFICCFNCGFHEHENSDTNTWTESLPLLLENKNVPLVYTSFTEDEAYRDASMLQQAKKNLGVTILKNNFSSLRPYRDPVSLGVFFNNEYIGIVSNDS